MTYAIVSLAVIAAMLVLLLKGFTDAMGRTHDQFVKERQSLAAEAAAEREDWAKERASLLDRIQHPQVFQAPSIPVDPGPPPIEDEWALVGTVFNPEPPEDEEQ